jgi:hypothetical protein
VLELLACTLWEKIKALEHLNIVISRLPIQRVQELQVEMVQDIKHRGDVVQGDLARIRDERS